MTLRVGVFSAKSYDESIFTSLSQHDDISLRFLPMALDAQTAQLCSEYDAVCVFVNDNISKPVIEALHQCGVKHIALRCAGFNNIDMQAATHYGIAVSRVPAYGPEAVAEHAIALMLTLNRKIHKAYNRVKEGNFELSGLMGFTLHNKTAGIIGTGRIGAATARILSGFGCQVLCYDPYPDEALKEAGVNYVTLDTLLEASHIVSLHCPLSEDTYHLINRETIAKMRDGVMLINTSRGGLVDTSAVIQGLKNRKIGYLGLDVYEMESELFFKDHSEQIIDDDVFERLATFHNVIITGHQGFFTQEALSQIAATTLENLRDFNKGKPDPSRFLSG
ncbi:2-hydroxyacid dehydrogenase [Alteromonas sp. H39]|uniref:2-hydroxyacid dehydrogenase n=1 Tax=Alteromonas sp. H39 TaxID=3389876 RepID=UPI0039E071BB